MFVTLADGTENILSNGGAFEAIDENNIDGAVYSRQDLTFNGSGTLTVTSPAGHGIVCKDDLVFTGGTYIVSSASLGFVYILSGTMDIEAEGDGISAGAYLQVQDGTINLLVCGGYENGTSQSSASYGEFKGSGKPGRSSARMVPEEKSRNMSAPEESSTSMTTSEESSTSMKGLKAVSGILISNGRITIDSADDSIHSDTSVIINGGTFEIASGDGLDSNETVTISDGYIYVANPTAGDTSIIDADVSPVITGGTFVSTGSTTMMAQTFASSSTQGVISCTTGTQSPGSVVTVKDSNGNSVISYEVEYSCAMVIISSPDIVKGDAYTLTIGSTSGSIQAE